MGRRRSVSGGEAATGQQYFRAMRGFGAGAQRLAASWLRYLTYLPMRTVLVAVLNARFAWLSKYRRLVRGRSAFHDLGRNSHFLLERRGCEDVTLCRAELANERISRVSDRG